MLTRENLKEYQPEYIFAAGAGQFPGLCSGSPVLWVAVRGGTDDWAIYYEQSEDWDHDRLEYIKKHGDKVYNKSVILDMVHPDDAAMERYRL